MSKTSSKVPNDPTLFEKIRQDRKFLESVFDRIPGMIYIHDLVNDVNLYRSWTLKKILGMEESEKLNSGKGIRSLIHADDISEFKRSARELQTLKDNECVRFTYRRQHASGKWLWFRSEEYVYERNSKGKPIKCLGYTTDLTSTIEQQQEIDGLNQVNQFLLDAARLFSVPDKNYKVALQELVEKVSLYLGAVCDISILNSESGIIRPEAFYHPDSQIREILQSIFTSVSVKRGDGLVGSVIESGKEVLINEVPDKIKQESAQIDSRIIPRSMMYAPLKGSHSILGSLNLTRLEGQEAFSLVEQNHIRRLASYIALFVENGILKESQKAEIELRQETERQLEAAKLALSKDKVDADEKYYDTILNNMGDPVFVKDDQSRFVLANDACCEIFGRPRSEIIGKTLAEDVPPDEREHFLKVDQQVIATGKESIVEEKLTIGDGETRMISTRKTRFIDQRGNKFLVVVIRDITEGKRAQAIVEKSNEQLEWEVAEATFELRQLVADLSHSNTLLESSIESHPGLISLSLDTDYRYYYFNKAHEEVMLLAYGSKPKIGDCIFDHMTIAEDVAQIKGNYDKALKGDSHTVISEYGSGEARLFYETTFSPILRDENVIGITAFAQNITERIESEKIARLSQERYETLSLNSGDAFFFHDVEQNILDVNLVATEMLGYSREEFLTMRADEIDPVWKGDVYLRFLKVLEINSPQTFDTTVYKKDGTEVPVEVRFVKRVEGDQTYIQSLMRDRTEKRDRELRLQRSEERLRLIFDNVEDHIATLNEDGIFESINKTSQGLQMEDVIGKSIFAFATNDEQLEVLKRQFELLKTTGSNFELSETYIGPDGSKVIYSRKFIGIFHGKKLYKTILLVRDVTAERDRKHAEMNAVLRGQEQERKRLGAELHDGIGQVLSAIALQVSQIREEVSQVEEKQITDDINSVNVNLQEAIREVRNISHDLMPEVLEGFGLREAINQTCNNLHDRSGITVMFDHVDLEARYDQLVEVNLFRIAQELLSNIQKHASCKKVFVSLMDHGESLNLTVEDDGVGFDVEKAPNGIGLSNVVSRVNSMSGQIDIESAENSGTLVNIDVPKKRE